MTSLNSFNVLDRHLNVRQSYLLEASAGTGKTYSIENIVVRLLIDNEADPITIDKILVVTFTRAATRELRQRIRHNVEKALMLLTQWLEDQSVTTLPDYLLALCENGEQVVLKAKRRLEDALFCFDQAQIFTIHGFCSRMLRENGFECDLGFELSADSEQVSQTRVISVIRDFFRTEVRSDIYSPEQLRILFKKYAVDKLEIALFKTITGGAEIVATPNFYTDFEAFKAAMQVCRSKGYISSQAILDDFYLQAPSFKEIFKKDGRMNPTIQHQIERFACLFEKANLEPNDFDQLIADGLVILALLDESNRKVRGKPISTDQLRHPNFLEDVRNLLSPIIVRASDMLSIYARMAHHCWNLFKRVSLEEESPVPDDLLHAMLKAIQQDSFADRVRQNYRAAIIDEFQDTDPIQWDIFRQLFAAGPCALYLVGDPKQSIYSFRQADIYTYLAAAQAIDKQNHASLDTNYRSQPSLVYALNALFSHSNAPGLIALPNLKKCLEYREVKASPSIDPKVFSDDRSSLHFCIAHGIQGKSKQWPTHDLEAETFFPFIVQEIQRLNAQDHLQFNQFAILVRDRYQAERIASFLKQWQIPVAVQRESSLADSPALFAIQECLEAALHPRDHSAIKTALGGKIIGWTDSQVQSLEQPEVMERIFGKWHHLRKQLLKVSSASFFQELLHSCWHSDNKTVMERLLSRSGGEDLYRDYQQIAGLLVDHQSQTHCSPLGLMTFLETFPKLAADDDEQLKVRQDPNRDAVQILTMHVSKGLEYDIVFALGLINRQSHRDELIPVKDQGRPKLAAPSKQYQEEAKKHQQETDAEKIRQLYVAMTRAKYRLYVPVAIADDPGVVPLGSASPMDLFLARFNQPAIEDDGLYLRIEENNGQALKSFIEKVRPEIDISYNIIVPKPDLKVTQISESIELIPPKALPIIPGFPSYIYSFSALAAHSSGDSVPHGTMPHDLSAMVKDSHSLPAGSETGILFHEIFETIPFKPFQTMKDSKSCLSLIRPILDKHPLQAWEDVIGRIVFNTLTKPIKDGWRLCDIDLQQAYREMEFLYPYGGENFQLPEEVRLENHFLKGYIDLFFQHQGKYYLVDWKSNWLGSNPEKYRHDMLPQAMQSHNYSLQATIYIEAVRRYLKLIDKRPFNECFGGVYYLFLRGIDPLISHNHGIHEWRGLTCAD